MKIEYSHEKQLIRDFIRYISDNHKACVVQFPDEYSSSQFVSYRFVNVGDIINEFIEEVKK